MTLMEEIRQGIRLPRPAQARLIRVSAGISQERLAHEIGVHRVTLARWESGTSSPRGTARARYSSILAQIQQELAAA